MCDVCVHMFFVYIQFCCFLHVFDCVWAYEVYVLACVCVCDLCVIHVYVHACMCTCVCV